jgi:hypothetical protein
MISARGCKDITDLRIKLNDIRIFDELLNFGLIKPRVDPEEDPLDQYIKNNMFPPFDM